MPLPPLFLPLLPLPRELSHARGRRVVCVPRFPFPDMWPTHSDNCMLVDVADDSEEWKRAATLLTASVTDATLVQRYACVCAPACVSCGTLMYPATRSDALAASKTDTSGSGIIMPNACGVMPWARPI